MLTRTAYDRLYYEQHRDNGLDYANYSDWQKLYGRWWVGSLGLSGRRVLDVGCACGAIAHGIMDAGAMTCTGIDLNEHTIGIARKQWPYQRWEICDAVNLHLFGDDEFDAIHSAQVAEHWKPELVPFILRELRRALRPGGLIFVALDTADSFGRQGRTPGTPGEDPTHICIKPLEWWREQFGAAGFVSLDDTALREDSIYREHFAKHDWDWLLAFNGKS
jgi:SAM-dependent methyltransferase